MTERCSAADFAPRPGADRDEGQHADALRFSRVREVRLSAELVDLVAARLCVIAEPVRIRLMGLLDEGDATAQELAHRLAVERSDLSGHLEVLHRAGFVSRRGEGPAVRYALIDWISWWLVEQMAAAHFDKPS